jgi:transcription initiation factor TFIIB
MEEQEDEAFSLIAALQDCTLKSPDKRCQCNTDDSYVCSKCGTVFDRFLDHGAEWRYFGNNDNHGKDPSRCGMPNNDLLPVGSLSTFVGLANGKCNKHMMNIARYQLWNSMPYKERTLFNAIDHLTVKAVNSGICPSIIDEAKVLYKRVCDVHRSRGDNRTGLLASSIYVACKNNHVPRSAKEIGEMFGIATTTITRNCKKFQELMNINLESSLPMHYVARFCSHLQLEQELQAECAKVVKHVHDNRLIPSSSPPSIVAGCIRFVTVLHKAPITKKQIAEACGVSAVTVAKCCRLVSSFSL